MRSTRCSTCRSDDVDAIEREIMDGGQVRVIARAHRVAESSLRRHVAAHLSPELRQAAQESISFRASNLVGRLVQLADDAAAVQALAMERGAPRTAVAAIDSERAVISVLIDRLNISDASVRDQLNEAAQVNKVLVEVLADAPEFAVPLAAALRRLGSHTVAVAVERRAAAVRAARDGSAPALTVVGASAPAPAQEATA